MNLIERTISQLLDWLTERTAETFDDESGQYSFTPWNIFWSVIFLFLVLAVLRHFSII